MFVLNTTKITKHTIHIRFADTNGNSKCVRGWGKRCNRARDIWKMSSKWKFVYYTIKTHPKVFTFTPTLPNHIKRL